MRLASLSNISCGRKTRNYTGMPGYLEFRSREPILPSGELRVSSNSIPLHSGFWPLPGHMIPYLTASGISLSDNPQTDKVQMITDSYLR